MNLAFLKNKEVKNAGWLIGEQIFQMLVSLFVGVLSARYLGPENYGALNYTASFVALFTSVATLGMDSVILKKMVEAPDVEGGYLGSCIFFRFLSSLLSTLGIGILVFILNPNDQLKLILALIQSIRLIFQSFHLLEKWFQRHLKLKFVAIGKMVACIIVSLYKIVLLATAQNIIWFAFANTLTEGIIVLILFFFYKRERGQKLFYNFSMGKEVLTGSYHFIISGLMVGVYSQMDKIMIGKMISDVDVGLYTTALGICSMWIFVPTAIINSFQSRIYELKQAGDEKGYLDRLMKLYSIIIWLSLFVSVIIALCSNMVVNVLYGEKYSGAADILRVAIWSEVFSMIGTMRGVWIVNEGKQKYVKYYLGCGALVNLFLNFILIPLCGGVGAAVATLVTQIVTSLGAPLLFKETRVFPKLVFNSFLQNPFKVGEK